MCQHANTCCIEYLLGAEIRNDACRERDFEFVGDWLLDSFPSDHDATAVIFYSERYLKHHDRYYAAVDSYRGVYHAVDIGKVTIQCGLALLTTNQIVWI